MSEISPHLTEREQEVLALVAQGQSNKEVAAQLSVSVHTVENHLQNTYRKLAARNRWEAVLRAQALMKNS